MEGRANTAVGENRPNFFHGTKQNGTDRDGTAQRKTDPVPFLFSYPFFQNGYTLNGHAYMGTRVKWYAIFCAITRARAPVQGA